MPAPRSDHRYRAELDELLAGMSVLDREEQEQGNAVRVWLRSGSPLWRGGRDGPSPHLVVYTVVVDPDLRAIHLGANRRARRWMPSGGHVRPGEDLEAAACRKLDEELGLDVPLLDRLSSNPLFLTVTDTMGPAPHRDVCLWFVFGASVTTGFGRDDAHVEQTRWWTFDEIHTVHPSQLHPAVVRFVAKLEAELD